MKKLFVLLALLIAAIASKAQSTVENTNTPKAMKPIIMVVPEKAWCINQGFVRKDNPQLPDYEKALLNDDVLNVITNDGWHNAGARLSAEEPSKRIRRIEERRSDGRGIDIKG